MNEGYQDCLDTKSYRENLVLSNMKLVTYLIKRYVYISSSDEFEDIFQSGCLGLVEAAINFDETRGNKFSTYAASMILGEIKRYQRAANNQFGGMHIARSIRDNIYKVSGLADFGYSNEEIANELGISASDVDKAKICISSIDAYISSDESQSITLGDTLGYADEHYNDIISENSFDNILAKLKEELSDRNYDIAEEIIYAYVIGGEKLTQEHLAFKYKCSQAQISRIRNRIKDVLEKIMKENQDL